MNTFLRFCFIAFVLIFYVHDTKASTDYFNSKLAALNYSDLSNEQQALLKSEVAAYEKTIAPLYKTNMDEYKKKLNDFFFKLTCGFKVYHLTAQNETLNSYIADFQSATGIKVYVISYVEGAFLNNMFQKLAELKYNVKQEGRIELKFKFTKVSEGDESLLYNGKCTLIADSVMQAKIKDNIKKNLVTTVSLDGDLELTDEQLNTQVSGKAEELLKQFSSLRIQVESSSMIRIANPEDFITEIKVESEGDYKIPAYRYAAVDMPVTFSESFIIKRNSETGVKDLRTALAGQPYIAQFIINKEEFINNHGTWLFDGKKEYKKHIPGDNNTIYKFNITLGYVYGVLALQPDLFDDVKYKASLESLFKDKEYVKEYFDLLYTSCISQNTMSLVEKGKSIDEIIRICDFLMTLDKDKWDRMYSNFGSQDNTIHSSSGYATLLVTIYQFCISLDGLVEKIMACETPGTKEGQMTYLARQLKESHYKILSPSQRLHIIDVISSGEMYRKLSVVYGETGEKDIVVNVLKYCTRPSDAEELTALLSKPGKSEGGLPVIANLVHQTDEFGGAAIFEQILGEITRLIQTSSGFQASVSEIFTESNIDKRVVKWDFPQLTNKTIDKYTGAIFISDIGYNEQTGKVTYRRKVLEKYYYKMRPELCMKELNPGCIKEAYDLEDLGTVSLDPMDLLVIIKHTDNSYGDVNQQVKDEVLFVPAYYLHYYKSVEALEKKIRAVAIAIDLATITSGAGIFTTVSPMLRRAWIGFRFLNAAGNITLNAANITDPTLRSVVLASDLVVGSIGFTELMMLSERISIGQVLRLAVKTTGDGIEVLKTNIKNFIENVERNHAALKALGVKEASMGKIVEDLFVLKDAWRVKAKEMWGVEWGNIGKITKVISIEELVSSIRNNVLLRIKNNAKYSLLFSNEELTELVNLGQKLKLTEEEIEAFVLAHCRRSQSASLNDMLMVMESITNKNINNNIGWKPGWNMLKAYKESQIKMVAGQFLDPSEYLTSTYINNHLANFNNKASYFVNKTAYKRYVLTVDKVGIVEDNSLYISSAVDADRIVGEAGNNLQKYEELLGFSNGHFTNGGEVWRINVKNPQSFGLRIPNGNEIGANHWWHPGGYTSGGVIEAVTNVIQKEINGIKFIVVEPLH